LYELLVQAAQFATQCLVLAGVIVE